MWLPFFCMQVLKDIEEICTLWAGLQKRMEAEKTVTISNLDLIVNEAFDIVLKASTDTSLCKQVNAVPCCAKRRERLMWKSRCYIGIKSKHE